MSQIESISEIHIVTRQKLTDRVIFASLEEVENPNDYDYFIIASETNKHYEQLEYIDKTVFGKKILCEKPLFDREMVLDIKNNSVYIGYVLRFHPLLQLLRQKLTNKNILCANVYCGQYLPSWRKNVDYRESYSAKKEAGGGVLLDLSHELDYVQWVCGKLVNIKSFQQKISDLEISSDDLVTLIARTPKGAIVTMSMDYISKKPIRRAVFHTNETTYDLDIINCRLVEIDVAGVESVHELTDLDRNSMFYNMHQSALNGCGPVCTYIEALNVMNTIKIIQEQACE